MAATRPSIMSEGATTSAPARACETAARASSGSVASLSTSTVADHAAVPVRGVLVQADVGHDERVPALRFLSARTVSWTAPPSSHASLPVSSFRSGIPKRMTPGTPERPELLRVGDGLVRREAVDARQGRNRLASGPCPFGRRAAPRIDPASGAFRGRALAGRASAGAAGVGESEMRSSVSSDYVPAAALASLASRPAALAKRASPDNSTCSTPRAASFSRVDGPSATAGIFRSRSAAGAARPAKSHSRRRRGRRAESRRRPFENLGRKGRVRRGRALSVQNDPAHLGAPLLEHRVEIDGRVLPARPQDAAAGERRGQSLEHGARRARRDVIGRKAVSPQRLRGRLSHRNERPGFEAAAQDLRVAGVARDLLDRGLARHDDRVPARRPVRGGGGDGLDGMADVLRDLDARDRAEGPSSGAHHEDDRPLQSPASPMSAAAPAASSRVRELPADPLGVRGAAGGAFSQDARTVAGEDRRLDRQRSTASPGPARRRARGSRPRAWRGSRARRRLRRARPRRRSRRGRPPSAHRLRARRSRGPPGRRRAAGSPRGRSRRSLRAGRAAPGPPAPARSRPTCPRGAAGAACRRCPAPRGPRGRGGPPGAGRAGGGSTCRCATREAAPRRGERG